MRWGLLLVMLLVGCKDKPASKPQVASGSVVASDAAIVANKNLDDAALAARFVELRDDRALGCLIEKTTKPNQMSPVLASVVEHSRSIVVARIVAFALVERAKQEGESIELAAIAEAVHALGPLGDVEGLKRAFQRVDQIQGVQPEWLYWDEAYRARVVRDLPKAVRTRGHLEWVTQTALGGQLALAADIYDNEIGKHDRGPSTDHVAALTALGRDAKVKELIATAEAKERARLVDAWLHTAAQMRKPLGDVTSEMASEIERDPLTPYPTRQTMRAVGRVDTAAAARIRKAMLDTARARGAKYPGAESAVYAEIWTSGSDAERAAVEAMVPAEVKAREHALGVAPLDEALAFAGPQAYPGPELARVWARAVVEDPAWLPRMAETVCAGLPAAQAQAPTPASAGLKLKTTSKLRARRAECEQTDVIVQVVNGARVVDEEILEGQCTGACTAAEKREGRKHVAEIEAQIERGEASESALDYNFTECQFSGHHVGKMTRVGDRDVALLEAISIGAHSVEQTSFQLAFESCGELFVSSLFGGKYAGGWRLEELTVEESPDGKQLRVRAQNAWWRGFLYRVALPVCPARPIEKINVDF